MVTHYTSFSDYNLNENEKLCPPYYFSDLRTKFKGIEVLPLSSILLKSR